jgi:hypothetical protein
MSDEVDGGDDDDDDEELMVMLLIYIFRPTLDGVQGPN